jgi:hypothetical protein
MSGPRYDRVLASAALALMLAVPLRAVAQDSGAMDAGKVNAGKVDGGKSAALVFRHKHLNPKLAS